MDKAHAERQPCYVRAHVLRTCVRAGLTVRPVLLRRLRSGDCLRAVLQPAMACEQYRSIDASAICAAATNLGSGASDPVIIRAAHEPLRFVSPVAS